MCAEAKAIIEAAVSTPAAPSLDLFRKPVQPEVTQGTPNVSEVPQLLAQRA
jgi:hypothetical protein